MGNVESDTDIWDSSKTSKTKSGKTIPASKTVTKPIPAPSVIPESLKQKYYETFAYQYIAELLKNAEMNELPFVTTYQDLLILLAVPPNCGYTGEDANRLYQCVSKYGTKIYGKYAFLPNNKKTRYSKLDCKYDDETHKILCHFYKVIGSVEHYGKDVEICYVNIDCHELNIVLKRVAKECCDYLDGKINKELIRIKNQCAKNQTIALINEAKRLNNIIIKWKTTIDTANLNHCIFAPNEIVYSRLLQEFIAKLYINTDKQPNNIIEPTNHDIHHPTHNFIEPTNHDVYYQPPREVLIASLPPIPVAECVEIVPSAPPMAEVCAKTYSSTNRGKNI